MVLLVPVFEGVRLHSYRGTHGTATLCYGETRNIHAGQTSTLEQCQEWLDRRMAGFLAGVDEALPGQPPKRRAALGDFCYNVGEGECERSSVFRLIRSGQIHAGCAKLRLYVYAGGKRLAGLVRRRAAEERLCVSVD